MVKKNHGKHNDNQKTSFMAIFKLGFNSETLRISPGFLKQGTHLAIISSLCREGQWVVEIYEFSKDQVYFSNGWEKFVEDHDLLEHDFLQFEHEEDNLFSVRIFQQNGLEKVYSNQEQPSSKISKHQLRQGLKNSNQNKLSSHHSISGKKRDNDIIQRKTKSFSSPNPFFSRLIKHYNVNINYTMSIPKAMANNIFSEKRREITLKNKEGRGWVVKMKNYNGQTFLIPKGWKCFVVDNSLKVGDVCIFELVCEGKFQVHIF